LRFAGHDSFRAELFAAFEDAFDGGDGVAPIASAGVVAGSTARLQKCHDFGMKVYAGWRVWLLRGGGADHANLDFVISALNDSLAWLLRRPLHSRPALHRRHTAWIRRIGRLLLSGRGKGQQRHRSNRTQSP
jgi:hypothetical protein